MGEQEKVYPYKLDFYYQSALIYLVTLVLYGGIRGNFVEAKFEYVLSDPLMYVIIVFVVLSFLALGLNYVRGRRLIITESAIVFKHRWAEHRLPIAEIEWMHIGRESRVQTSGRFQVVVMKIIGKRRLVRVRVGRYEREKDLVAEMNRIASVVPRCRPRRWRRPRRGAR